MPQETDKGQNKFGEGLENVLGAKRIQKCTNATVLQIDIYILKYTSELMNAIQSLLEQLLTDMSSVPFIL